MNPSDAHLQWRAGDHPKRAESVMTIDDDGNVRKFMQSWAAQTCSTDAHVLVHGHTYGDEVLVSS
jgi:hypothetical protein